MASGLSASELQNVSATMQSSNMGNRADIEMQWAMKASDHADVYFNLISSVDSRHLKLTAMDDEIYSKFRATFPDMKVDVLDEQELKSAANKAVWREFIEEFKGTIEDYNYGTLIRLDCAQGYTEQNSTFCVRTQFLAIEIARNRENFNNCLHSSSDDKTQAGSS